MPNSDPEPTESPRQNELLPENEIAVDMRKPLLGGVLAVFISLAGAWMVGRLHGAEGLLLLQAMLPTTRFLCSSVMTATATILALMLTLLGLSTSAASQIHPSHYKRVQQIALLDMIAFVGATLFLLALNIPVEESDSLTTDWYNYAYYSVLVYSSVLGGVLISIVLMLYAAIRDMISVVALQREDHPLYQGAPESSGGEVNAS